MIRKKSARVNPVTLKQLHARTIIRGLTSNLQSLRDLLLSCIHSFHGNMDHARNLFDRIPQPDLFMHNTMIRGYAHSATPSAAFAIYRRMNASWLSPDSFTFCYLLKACTKCSSACAGSQLHGLVAKLGFSRDAFVRNALINMHANCGDLTVAGALLDEADERDVVARSAVIAGHAARGNLDMTRRLFDECRHKDPVCWNIMIGWYAKHGEMEKARELFDRAPVKDVVSWNTVITGYAARGSLKQALEVFNEMTNAGKMPDESTVVSLLSCCANSGSLETGKMIHSLVLEKQPWISIVTGNALIAMYAKCGDVEHAMEVFGNMKERDVRTWNSIIGGLAFHGQAQESVKMFEKMREEKVRPNEVSFLCVLGACSHAGLVEDGRRYFSLMSDKHGIEPHAKHYSCMADMLGRAGLLDEAFALVNSMRTEASAVVWRTLLGACRIHDNVALGEVAKEKILQMREDASGDYVLLSGMYASSGEWLVAERMRRSIDEKGVRKEAGYAMIDQKSLVFSTT